jgi:hypothetical protein
MKNLRLNAVRLIALTVAVNMGMSLVQAQTVRVVNMIPAAQSNESTRDAEPNITVNPTNRLQIAATAFTPDPMASGNSPIFASIDGGLTWNLNGILLPGAGCASSATCDATVRFGGSSNVLYAGILRGDNSHLNILRTNNFLTNALMTILIDRGNDDQPWVAAHTVLEFAGAGNDRVYVGNNDSAAAAGKTATVDLSLNSATALPPAGFGTNRIEVRATSGSDLAPIRTTAHLDGTVYAAFYGQRAGGTDVVVVRDDNWADSAMPYTSLLESGTAGQRVATGLSVNFGNLGHQRTGSNLAIAVDPNNSRVVYVAFVDGPSASQTVHVRNSIDGGQNWSADLRTVSPATNPALAINSHGKVGFMYQQLVSGRWQTHLVTTTNAFTSVSDLTLADVPDSQGAYIGSNTIGDYINLIAANKDFYGVFSGFNTPDNTNFPNLVTYQRFADFTTHQLFADAAHTVVVPASIDVFFVHYTEMPDDQDFYVRDWTDSMTVFDQGQEPSFRTDFWDFSDVWNRAANSAGAPNANDQFSTDPMQAGMGSLGDNFGFVRVKRNATGTAATVTAHFLVSPFGTGSNYQNAGVAADPTLNFAAGDSSLVLSSGYPWHQDPTASTHACIAVEIAGPSDQIIPPSMVGTAPGWPAGIAVVEDNNKAQRNLSVAHNMGDSDSISYALIHNAANFARDFQLRYEAPRAALAGLRNARVSVVGSEEREFKSGDTITLKNMKPGENRWVALNVKTPKSGGVPVNFYELFNGRVVNGFTIRTEPVSLNAGILENIKAHAHAFNRLAASFNINGAAEEGASAGKLADLREISRQTYLDFLKTHTQNIDSVLNRALESLHGDDPFRVRQTLKDMATATQRGDVVQAAAQHSVLINKLDAFTTMLQKEQGDPADVLQMVRWQRDLYSMVPRLREFREFAPIITRSQEFIDAFGRHKTGAEDYQRLLKSLLPAFQATASRLSGTIGLESEVKAIEGELNSVPSLEKAHRNYLLKLETLTKR